jgi:hypothetical protein
MFRTFGLWNRYAAGLMPCFDASGDGGGGGGDADAIKKANFERDTAIANAAKLQAQIDDLKKLVPSADQQKRLKELEDAAAKAEEDRKTKAGEWESLKLELVTKHNAELEKFKTEIALAEHADRRRRDRPRVQRRLRRQVAAVRRRRRADGPAAGSGEPALRKYVSVEMVDGKPVLKVKDANGKVVIDTKTGNPMDFGPAMHQVITACRQRSHSPR